MAYYTIGKLGFLIFKIYFKQIIYISIPSQKLTHKPYINASLASIH